jgi:hypothetical protein
MAQTGFTPIQLYYSSTTTNVPLAANLANGELAINITDGKLFYKDNLAAVQVIGWKTTPTSAGGTGLTSYTAGDTLYYASGTTLTKLAIGTAYQAFQVNAGATAPSWQPSATSVLTTQGDLLYASGANTLARLAKDANATRYLSNTGTSNNPAWAQISLTAGVTGILPVTNGGTNASSASITAFNNITGYSASGATGTTTTNLVFSTSPTLVTPTLGAALATSIKFGSGSVLSSYEEGTFTPVYQTSGTAATITYAVQVGNYVKIGRMVYFSVELLTTAITGGTGDLYLGGLPFAIGSGRYNAGSFAGYYNNWTINAPNIGYGYTGNSFLYLSTSSVLTSTTVTIGNLTNGTVYLNMYGSYMA